MLNRRGQGLTEYGIILLLILGVGMGVWSSSGIAEQDKSMFGTISSNLQSIVDGISEKVRNYDTQTLQPETNRRNGGYKTELSFSYNGKKYDILWRYEGTRKVYTIVDDSISYMNYTGTDGLMINPDLKDQNGGQSYKSINGRDYASVGYVDNGTYKTTYFNLDGKTYQIDDYGNKNTILTNYVGSSSAKVTAMVNGTSTSTTVGALASARTSLINSQITDATNVAIENKNGY